MFIFNSFSLGFSSLCHAVLLVLNIFLFCETDNFYVSAMERLRQRGRNETKSVLKKYKEVFIIYEKTCEFS